MANGWVSVEGEACGASNSDSIPNGAVGGGEGDLSKLGEWPVLRLASLRRYRSTDGDSSGNIHYGDQKDK